LHDILTGSTPEGTAIATSTDATCKNGPKTAKARPCSAITTARASATTRRPKSWNSSHFSRGCSLEALKSTGGGGLFYCFAAD